MSSAEHCSSSKSTWHDEIVLSILAVFAGLSRRVRTSLIGVALSSYIMVSILIIAKSYGRLTIPQLVSADRDRYQTQYKIDASALHDLESTRQLGMLKYIATEAST